MTRTVLDRQLQDLSEQLLQMWALSDQAFEKGLEALQRWDPIDVTDSAAIHGLVRAGMGIAFIPAYSWWMRTAQDIHALHIDEPSCQRTIGLAWRKDRYL